MALAEARTARIDIGLDREGRVVFDMLGGSPRVHDLLAPVVAPLVAVVPDDE